MAKDGTNRGGARPGAGRPRKALTEKIAEGKSAEVMMQPADIESAETPPVRDFMKELQRDGTKLLADELNDSVAWVKEQYQKALKKLSAETEDSCKGCDCCAEEM